jgi:hypothetical protein
LYLGCRLHGLGVRVQDLGVRVEGSRFAGLGFRIQGFGARVQGSWLRGSGHFWIYKERFRHYLGFRVEGLPSSHVAMTTPLVHPPFFARLFPVIARTFSPTCQKEMEGE